MSNDLTTDLDHESEAAIEALLNDFKSQSFPEGWETALLEAAVSAPIIRLDASEPALPEPPRVIAPPSFWTRHQLTLARLAAGIIVLALAGVGIALLSGGSSDNVETAATTNTETTSTPAPPSIAPSTTATGPTTELPGAQTSPTDSADPANSSVPSVEGTTPPATTPSSATPPTTATPATGSPTTNPPSTTVAPTTTLPPSTASSATTATPTTAAPTTTTTSVATTPSTETIVITTTTTTPTTTEPTTTTTQPTAADVVIRSLTVGRITPTSAVVAFRTNDCAGASYAVSGVGVWADGYPAEKQCWNRHAARLGQSPFSGPLTPGTKYTVRVTTIGPNGETDSASISFETPELEPIEPIDPIEPADPIEPDPQPDLP